VTNVCTICKHPARLKIDIALLRGESCPVIATRFKVSVQALQRHKRNGHILRRLQQANELLDQEKAVDLVKEARRILSEMQTIVYMAEVSCSYRTAIEGLRAQLEVLKTMGLESQTSRTSDIVPEILELAETIRKGGETCGPPNREASSDDQ
jgi:hypothetical protein